MLYMILEPNNVIFDGEWLSKEALFRALPHADRDARVAACDLADFRDGGSARLADVTNDILADAWMAGAVEEDTPICVGSRWAAQQRIRDDEASAGVPAIGRAA
jgi:hypothetical protein